MKGILDVGALLMGSASSGGCQVPLVLLLGGGSFA